MIRPLGTKPLFTERLLLRQYRLSDAEKMYWCRDPAVCRFYTWEPHRSPRETEELVKLWIGQEEDPYNFHWLIADRETGRLMGSIYLEELDISGAQGVLGYLLGRKDWGRGVAAEAARSVIRFAFEEAGFERVSAHHHTQNPRSGRVLEKCGFRFQEQRYVPVPECPRIQGEYRFYTLERRDWDRYKTLEAFLP